MTCETPIPLNLIGSPLQGPPGEIRNNNALLVFSTFAKAEDAAKTLADEQIVYVLSDETRNNLTSEYKVINGILVFERFSLRDDITNKDKGGNIVAVDLDETPTNDTGATYAIHVVETDRNLKRYIPRQYWAGIAAKAFDEDLTEYIQLGLDDVGIRGGSLFGPPGGYGIYKSNPTGSTGSNPDDAALLMRSNNVRFFGAGNATHLKALRPSPSTPTFLMIRAGKLPIVNGELAYRGIRVDQMQFDGSYVPTVGQTDISENGTLIWWHGIENGGMDFLWMHNAGGYALGMQNGGHKDCNFSRLLIEDTLADGIDVKNNGDSDYGNSLNMIIVRRFGRGYLPSDPYAGIDLMGPWNVSNIFVEQYGEAGSTVNAGIRFKQGESADSRGSGGHNSNLTNFHIDATGSGAAVGCVKSSARGVSMSNGTVVGATEIGVLVEQYGNELSNIKGYNCATTFHVRNSSYGSNGDETTLTGCHSRYHTDTGFNLSAANVSAIGCHSVDGNIGARFSSASTGSKWIGGSLSRNTKPVVNNNADITIRNASGFKTEGYFSISISTASLAVGVRTVDIPHDLGYQPRVEDITPKMVGGGDNFTFSSLRVRGVTPTNINVIVNVTNAPTSNPTLHAEIVVQKIPAIA